MSLSVGFLRFLFTHGPSNVGVVQLRYSRRMVSPPPWVPRMYKPIRADLYKADRALIEQELGDKPALNSSKKLLFSPEDTFHLIPGISNPPDCTQNQYAIECSKRIGLIGRKIGMTLQWQRDGTRCLCTLIHVPVNHVLSANDPETWYQHSLTGKQKAFRGVVSHRISPPMWSQMVGVEDFDSPFLNEEYKALFKRAGVPCKKFLAGFIVSGDAVVKPGTQLDVRHFKPGQWISAAGRTIDWGFQGVMHRWGMKGQMRLSKGPTKAHRRVGAIGTKGEAKVWPGRCLPGHMGYEWRNMVGVKILRINPIKQVIYVRGNVPGDINEWILLKDCFVEKKQVEDPPFPTFYPTEEDEEEMQMLSRKDSAFTIVSKDLYDTNTHQFSHPSVLYTEADETKLTMRDRSRAKTAKVKK